MSSDSVDDNSSFIRERVQCVDVESDSMPVILDGTFFRVKSYEPVTQKVTAYCVNCPKKLLSGQVNATSNFLKHLEMGSRQFSDRSHAEIYSIYRPDIPEEVIRRIVSYLRDKFHGSLDKAVDVGCGSGQSTVALAPFFKHVFGIDGSKAQIEEVMNSRIWPNISFNVGPAEEFPFPDNSVQLVTACASLHWFEQRAFFSEIRRILSPGEVFAAYTYHYIKPFSENKECAEQIDRLFAEKCKGLNVYYAKEVFSSLNKYRDVDFPFEEVSRVL